MSTPTLKLKVFHANDTHSLEQQFNDWSESEQMIVIQDKQVTVSPRVVYAERPDLLLSVFYYVVTEEMMAEQVIGQMGE